MLVGEMENSTLHTQEHNLSSTTPILDYQVEPWKIAVPLFLLLFLALVVIAGSLIVLFYYKKCYKNRAAVFPVIVVDQVAEPDKVVSNYRRSVTQTTRNTRQETSMVKKKPPSLPNALHTLAGFDEEFRPTRTKSLTVLIPEGKRLSEVFSPKVDTGELKEPEKMDGKWRWQISLLEMMEPDQQSINESLQSNTAEDEEDISETLYRQGVYMNWEDTLLDLRTAFIDTKQIEKDEASFCFLWTDVLGEHIDIDSESGTCLSRLSRSAVSSRTVYIERVDQDAVRKCLCVCGKHALFQCIHCQDRGYCSHSCEQEDSDHVFCCSANIR